ncbi:MAG: oligosaccharide flippase family protein [Natrialbaceae archaeon]|nr:oligosaccharide flippase family protein [Natrialbaceae archaeon]
MNREALLARFRAELVGRVVVLAATGATMVLLARLLDPASYGQLFLAIAIFGVLGIIAKLGIAKSTARYLAEYKEADPTQLRHILASALALNLATITLVTLALLVGHQLLAEWLGEPELAPFLLLGVGYVAAEALATFVRLVLQGLEAIQLAAGVLAIDRVARLLLAVGLVLKGFGALGALGGFVASAGIAAGLGLALIHRRYYRPLEVAPVEPGLRRRLAEYTIPLTATSSANVIDKKVDTVLVGIILSPVAVSAYVIAKQVVDFVGTPVSALGFTLSPTFGAEKAAGNVDRAARLYEMAMVQTLALYVPVAAGIVLVADPTVVLLFGPDYASAVPVLQVLAIYAVLRSITKLTSNGLDYLGRARARAIVKGVTAVANAGLTVLLLLLVGVVGAAIATACTYGCYTIANLVISLPGIRSPGRVSPRAPGPNRCCHGGDGGCSSARSTVRCRRPRTRPRCWTRGSDLGTARHRYRPHRHHNHSISDMTTTPYSDLQTLDRHLVCPACSGHSRTSPVPPVVAGAIDTAFRPSVALSMTSAPGGCRSALEELALAVEQKPIRPAIMDCLAGHQARSSVLDACFAVRRDAWRFLVGGGLTGRCLEVGARFGRRSEQLSEAVETVYAVDHSLAHLRIAAERTRPRQGVIPVNATVDQLPFAAGSMDTVVADLDRLAGDPARHLDILSSMVADGGTMYVLASGWTRSSGLAARFGLERNETDRRGHSAWWYRRRCGSMGFESVDVYGLLPTADRPLYCFNTNDRAAVAELGQFLRGDTGLLATLTARGLRSLDRFGILEQCLPSYLIVCGDTGTGPVEDIVEPLQVLGRARSVILEPDGRRVYKIPNCRRNERLTRREHPNRQRPPDPFGTGGRVSAGWLPARVAYRSGSGGITPVREEPLGEAFKAPGRCRHSRRDRPRVACPLSALDVSRADPPETRRHRAGAILRTG